MHLLKKYADVYQIRLTAVHIHHGMRGKEADEDAVFCEATCKAMGIPFVIHCFDIRKEAKLRKLTEEEAGRKTRYECFYAVMKERKGNKIAVAHNQNDQAETLLMRLFRGSGIKGLAGIAVRREEIIRPLLYVARSQIEAYCKENTLLYRNDCTNEETKYTRNSIRNIVLPNIQRAYNPNIIATLSHTATMIQDENEFLEKLCHSVSKEMVKEENDKTIISIEALKKQDIVLQRRIVRQAYLKYSADLHDISWRHVNMILELLNKESGKEINLPHGLKAAIQYGHLCLYRQLPKQAPFACELAFDKEILLEESKVKMIISLKNAELDGNPYTKVFDYDKINNGLILRNRQVGDRIFSKALQGNKKLKDYCIDEKIPRGERDKMVLLADGQDIVWIVGRRISDRYAVTKDTKNFLYVFLQTTNKL